MKASRATRPAGFEPGKPPVPWNDYSIAHARAFVKSFFQIFKKNFSSMPGGNLPRIPCYKKSLPLHYPGVASLSLCLYYSTRFFACQEVF